MCKKRKLVKRIKKEGRKGKTNVKEIDSKERKETSGGKEEEEKNKLMKRRKGKRETKAVGNRERCQEREAGRETGRKE